MEERIKNERWKRAEASGLFQSRFAHRSPWFRCLAPGSVKAWPKNVAARANQL